MSSNPTDAFDEQYSKDWYNWASSRIEDYLKTHNGPFRYKVPLSYKSDRYSAWQIDWNRFLSSDSGTVPTHLYTDPIVDQYGSAVVADSDIDFFDPFIEHVGGRAIEFSGDSLDGEFTEYLLGLNGGLTFTRFKGSSERFWVDSNPTRSHSYSVARPRSLNVYAGKRQSRNKKAKKRKKAS